MKRIEFINKLDNNIRMISTNKYKTGTYKFRFADDIISMLPKKLYRYRNTTIKDQNGDSLCIKALEKNEIWGSTLSTMNDPFECLPYIDTNKCYNRIREIIDSSSLLERFIKDREKRPFNENEVELYELIKEYKKKIPFAACVEAFNSIIKENLYNRLGTLSENDGSVFLRKFKKEQDQYLIACFSEELYSSLMWSHYANSHKGFCIEYELRNEIKRELQYSTKAFACLELSLPIVPTAYIEKRIDASDLLLISKLNDAYELLHEKENKMLLNNQLLLKSMIGKNINWSYEKEWRLFSTNLNNVTHDIITILIPSAVYLGYEMDEDDSRKIHSFCKRKGIPCYKMKINIRSPEYKLYPELM